LVAGAGIWLMQGLLERYIRHAAKRRFRSSSGPAVLAEDSSASDRAPCLWPSTSQGRPKLQLSARRRSRTFIP
jgi:hypothetical protein